MPAYHESQIVRLLGDINGVNNIFTTPSSFLAGSIRLLWNGDSYEADHPTYGWTEINQFTIQTNTAPTIGTELQAFYQEHTTDEILSTLVDVKGTPLGPPESIIGPCYGGGAWACVCDGVETIDADCLISDSIGKWVYVTGPSISAMYQVSTADPYDANKLPAFGIIVEK